MSLIPALVMSAAALAGHPSVPGPAVAAGIAAYDRGDFMTALAILKPIVYDDSADWPVSDPWALVYLAQMFRRGEGTAPDWPLSCALFNNARSYGLQRGPTTVDPLPFFADGIKEVCLPEIQPEVLALLSSCFLDGVTRQEFVLDGGAWVVFDRRGFHADLAGEHRDGGIPLWGCHDVMVSLTESDVSLPYGSSNRRIRFLEMFKWTSRFDTNNGHMVRQLHWIVYGVAGTVIGPATDQTVLTVVGGPYPSAEMPPGIRDAVSLRPTAAGDVEWILKVAPRKRGIIKLKP